MQIYGRRFVRFEISFILNKCPVAAICFATFQKQPHEVNKIAIHNKFSWNNCLLFKEVLFI